ncbi:MAG: hypothetical protein AAF570_19300, partial [Bacteroidota bacterium]
IKGLLQQRAKSKQTNIGSAVEWVQRITRRKAIFIIISDFIDDGYEKALKHLARKHEVILVRLFNPNEILKNGIGTIPIYDQESGRMVWINSGDGGYRSVVAKRFEEIEDKLKTLCRRNRMDLLSVDTSTDYTVTLERFFRKRNARKGKG